LITHSVEIDRPQADVFAYLDEPEKHSEWQEGLVSSKVETDGPVRVGTRVVDTRKMPGGPRDMTYEITQHNPPSTSGWRGVDGPVRADGTFKVESIGEGARSRVTVELNLTGHGIGVLLAPMARMQAAKQVPKSHAKLKEILERRA
jgi:uncharacterized membrane protein